jgi:hypothetical protein
MVTVKSLTRNKENIKVEFLFFVKVGLANTMAYSCDNMTGECSYQCKPGFQMIPAAGCLVCDRCLDQSIELADELLDMADKLLALNSTDQAVNKSLAKILALEERFESLNASNQTLNATIVNLKNQIKRLNLMINQSQIEVNMTAIESSVALLNQKLKTIETFKRQLKPEFDAKFNLLSDLIYELEDMSLIRKSDTDLKVLELKWQMLENNFTALFSRVNEFLQVKANAFKTGK